MVALDSEIDRISDLAAVPFNGKILLFGGTRRRVGFDYCTDSFFLDEEGKLVRKVEGYYVVPRYMGKGSVTMEKGKLYGVGSFEFE